MASEKSRAAGCFAAGATGTLSGAVSRAVVTGLLGAGVGFAVLFSTVGVFSGGFFVTLRGFCLGVVFGLPTGLGFVLGRTLATLSGGGGTLAGLGGSTATVDAGGASLETGLGGAALTAGLGGSILATGLGGAALTAGLGGAALMASLGGSFGLGCAGGTVFGVVDGEVGYRGGVGVGRCTRLTVMAGLRISMVLERGTNRATASTKRWMTSDQIRGFRTVYMGRIRGGGP